MTWTPDNPLPQNGDGEMELLRKLVHQGALAARPYQSGTNLYAFGDSWTEGIIAVSIASWAPGQIVTAALRYANILATATGQTLSNYGVAGSGFGYSAGTSFGRATPMNRLGRNLPVTWSGTATLLAGYNDALASTSESLWFRHYVAAADAFIARALLSGYVTAHGKDHTGANYTVTTTGTVTDEGLASDAVAFPYGLPGTDTRRVCTLTGTQTFSATLTGRTHAAVFYDASATAGAFKVSVDGVQVAEVTVTHPAGTVATYGVVVIRNLATSAVVTVTNVSGSSRIWSIGWLEAANTAANLARSVVVASPGRLGSANRSDSMLQMIGRACLLAAGRWSEYRVFFADVGGQVNSFDSVTASGDGTDPDHPSRGGNRHIARIFASPTRVNTATASQWIPAQLSATEDIIARGVGAVPNTPAVYVAHVAGDGYVTNCSIAGGVIGGTLFLRGTSVAVNNGSFDLFRVNSDGSVAFRAVTADPASPQNGWMWYNSTTGKFRVRAAGVSTDLH
jgi:hypothetical protein